MIDRVAIDFERLGRGRGSDKCLPGVERFAFGALGGASDGFQSLVSLFEKLLKPVRLVAVCGVARATALARRRRRRRGVAFRAFRTLVGATAGVGRRHARRTRSEGRAKRRAACECACECVWNGDRNTRVDITRRYLSGALVALKLEVEPLRAARSAFSMSTCSL